MTTSVDDQDAIALGYSRNFVNGKQTGYSLLEKGVCTYMYVNKIPILYTYSRYVCIYIYISVICFVYSYIDIAAK